MSKIDRTEADALDDAAEWAEDEIASVSGFIQDRPFMALAIAAAFGFVIAKLAI
jgi:ElaB/YqjD/DUF883 family membrane-anchored ribosome-binding protein